MSSIEQEQQVDRISNVSRFSWWWKHKSNFAVNLSVVVLIIITLMSAFAAHLSPHDPHVIDLRSRLLPPAWVEGSGRWSHPFGTDRLGRDVFSRTLHGGRVSLSIGVLASVAGLVVGTTLGLISGYIRGRLDHLIMYLIDVQLSLPFILLAIAVALILGNSLIVLIGIAALSAWPFYARVVRGNLLSLRNREFTLAAQALGRIARSHYANASPAQCALAHSGYRYTQPRANNIAGERVEFSRHWCTSNDPILGQYD